MTIQQTVRKTLANSGRQVRDVFRSKASIQKKRESLFAQVQSGRLVKELFSSEVWQKVLEPCVDNIRDRSRFDLENDRSLYDEKDVGRYYPRGGIHTITEIKSVLKKIIEQAQIARQELDLLQKEERQDNV